MFGRAKGGVGGVTVRIRAGMSLWKVSHGNARIGLEKLEDKAIKHETVSMPARQPDVLGKFHIR